MFRFEEKKRAKFVKCNGQGPHVTKNGSASLKVGYHKYVSLEDGTILCDNCAKSGQGPRKPKPESISENIRIEHETIGRIWDIRRSRQRKIEYDRKVKPGSDMWICNKCGRRGDFWYFRFVKCPKNEPLQEDTIELERRESILLEDFGE